MEAKDLPAEFADAIHPIDYASGSCKLNLTLGEVPDFTCLRGNRGVRHTTSA